MRTCVLVSLLFVVLLPRYPSNSIQQSVVTNCSQPTEYGGQEHAPYISSTWHASLYVKIDPAKSKLAKPNEDYRQCSGVIVNRRMILTSASCLDNAQQTGWMIFYNFEGKSNYLMGARRLVTHIRIYDAYKKSSSPETDFALVYITDPITFNETVSKVDLAVANVRDMAANYWTSCQISGSGDITINGHCTPTDLKKYMTGFIVSRECCERALGQEQGASPFNADSLCFRSLNSMPCEGDAGAGLSCVNSFKQRKIVGLVSGGQKCCDSNKAVTVTPRERRISAINAGVDAWLAERISGYDNAFPED